ncbi:hypothetical protein [Roseovarius rhodophyticola]|uniref:Argininosuccinate lyase n=1 Tax=Roseovarius rhodophyticola TaxID=3080827 RepID=A0ABZ2TFI5_9RHOB|nr:hypothetical protein [Roseovarius sp. W115]MDV2928757.1 hypothetical protein [Roseovarius sp. W115]
MSKSFLLAVMASLVLAGCDETVAGVGEPELVQRLETAPPERAPEVAGENPSSRL